MEIEPLGLEENPIHPEVLEKVTDYILSKYGDDPQGLQDMLAHLDASTWGKLGEELITQNLKDRFDDIYVDTIEAPDGDGHTRRIDIVGYGAKEEVELKNMVSVNDKGNLRMGKEIVKPGESIAIEVKNGGGPYNMQEFGSPEGHGIKQVEAMKGQGYDHVVVNFNEDFIKQSLDQKQTIIKNIENTGGTVRIGLPSKDAQLASVLGNVRMGANI